MSVNIEVIKHIRRKFLSFAQNNSHRFHPKDVERAKNNDWTIKRFVLAHKSDEEALKALIKAMEWRKSFGVNDFTDVYFPEEVYKIGEFSVHYEDKEGRQLIWFRLERHHKSPELGLFLRKYMVYNIEKVDRLTKNQGWAMIIDCTGSGLSNADIDFSKFCIEVFDSYYPKGERYTYIVELPKVMKAVSKLVVSFLSDEMKTYLKFLNKDELAKYVASGYLPLHLNGTYDKEWVVIPAGVKPLEHPKLSDDQVQNNENENV